jgi:hypothetical protein
MQKKPSSTNDAASIWDYLFLLIGCLSIVIGFVKNYLFLNGEGGDGRLEMGREAFHEIMLFGCGIFFVFMYFVTRNRKRKIIVSTWIAMVLLALLAIFCAYCILKVMPT